MVMTMKFDLDGLEQYARNESCYYKNLTSQELLALISVARAARRVVYEGIKPSAVEVKFCSPGFEYKTDALCALSDAVMEMDK